MKILYIGKHHNTRSNDDEGAITRSLIELGHEVKTVLEHKVDRLTNLSADLCLFNHYKTPSELARLDMPKVFWCFDRIEWDDSSLKSRNEMRKEWIKQATDVCDIGFMTDGDWIAKDTTAKLVWLTQGFNQYLTSAVPSSGEKIDILMTAGCRAGGQQRQSFLREMQQRYGDRFRHIEKGYHGQNLAQAIADAKIVVAPDSPITDKYWSNRVYLILGLGGFLLHPYAEGLFGQFEEDSNIVLYKDREQLHNFLSYYLQVEPNVQYGKDYEMKWFRKHGQTQVLSYHTYKHRCQTLITTVQERLGL